MKCALIELELFLCRSLTLFFFSSIPRINFNSLHTLFKLQPNQWINYIIRSICRRSKRCINYAYIPQWQCVRVCIATFFARNSMHFVVIVVVGSRSTMVANYFAFICWWDDIHRMYLVNKQTDKQNRRPFFQPLFFGGFSQSSVHF